MKRRLQVALLATAMTAIFSGTARAQCQLDELQASLIFNPFGFGQDVALSSERAIVGGFLNNEHGFQVFDRVGDQWYATETLLPRVGTNFNGEMDMEEDIVVCGMGNDGTYGEVDPNAPAPSGECDIYDLETPGGFVKQTIQPSDAEAGQRFGTAVSVDKNIIIVGAPGDNQAEQGAGAVYVFELINDVWQETAKIMAQEPEPFAGFGAKVKIDGDRMIVTGGVINFFILPANPPNDTTLPSFAPFAFDETVYVFERRLGHWHQTAALDAPSDRIHSFGRTLDIAGDQIMVSAITGFSHFFGAPLPIDPQPLPGIAPPVPTDPQPNFGVVFIYEKQGHDWVEVAMLRAPNNADFDNYGASLDMCGDYAIVGSPPFFVPDEHVGAFVYKNTDQGWRLNNVIEQGTTLDQLAGFASAVALTEHMAIVGSPNTMNAQIATGSAQLYGVGEDCSGNGKADACDIMRGDLTDTDGDMIPDGCETGGATPFCNGSLNSLGIVSDLHMQGESSVEMNSFALRVDNAIPSNFGVFLVGTGDTHEPFGSGMRCVGGTQMTQFSAFADDTGVVVRNIDVNAPFMGITPFTSLNFQYVYRDGAEIHLTNAVEVTFTP